MNPVAVFPLISSFLLASLIELFSPLTSWYWERRIDGEAAKYCSSAEAEKVVDQARYAIDTVRMFTTSLLTAVSGLVVLSRPYVYSVVVFVILVVLFVTPYFWTPRRFPEKYATESRYGYTPASVFILIANLGFVAMVLISRP